MEQLATLIREIEKFYTELSRNYYRFGAGLQDELPLKAIYRKYSSIFTRQTLQLVKGRLESIGGGAGEGEGSFFSDEERRLTYLLNFLRGGFLSEQVKELTEEISSLEAGSTLEVDGREYPFRYARVLIANEKDPGKRRSIASKREAIVEQINPLREEQIASLHRLCRDLGFSSYVDAYEQINGFNFFALKEQLEAFLEETRELYYEYFNRFFEEQLGFGLQEGEQADFSYLFRAPHFDQDFPGEKAVPVLKSTLKKMGVDLDGQPNIKLDVEKREKKSPRAFCSAIRIPDEVYLVINPRGGQDDYHSLFHESGHAEHFGNVAPDLPFEFKRFGDKSVTETYAFLHQYLLTNPYWLRDELGLSGQTLVRYLDFALANKLYMLRRYAAKFLYELKLHSSDEEPVRERSAYYARYLTGVLGAEHHSVNYLDDTDLGFYSGQYLRAWFFEVQLRNYLIKELGENWYRKKAAGEILQELWVRGQKYSVDELAGQLGYKGVSIKPAVEEIVAALD